MTHAASIGLGIALLGMAVPTPALQQSGAVTGFNRRVEAYVQLQQRLRARLPRLASEASPEEIARSQGSLAAEIRGARTGARRGDIFGQYEPEIRRLLTRVFRGPEGARLRAAILDEYPGNIRLEVNAAYPSVLPLASTPTAVLAVLPKLPEQLEYRFVGRYLTLFDREAQIIPDFIPAAFPAEDRR